MAGAPLKVLIVEDSPSDAALVALELRRAGFQPDIERVETSGGMNRALDQRGPDGFDVIIADYRMPNWSGLGALGLIQERKIDLPFIVVSGAIGEETAVEAMRAGAHDYVLKQNLTRLGAAVTRELREAQVRRERRQALEALGQLAHRSAFLSEASRILSASLNYEETLLESSRVVVPEAAEWCVVTVPEGTRRLRAVITHVEPDRATWAREYLRAYPLDPAAPHGAAEVIRTGQCEWTSAQTALMTMAPPSETPDLARELGHESGVCLPMVARGRIMGAITLVRASSVRTLGREDLSFVEELAGRAAMALDNATLYREAREAIAARDEFLSVASHELNTPLATLSLQLEQLARTVELPKLGRSFASGFSRAQRQVDRLTRLVENLLDISRIAAHRLQLAPVDVDLTAITREVVEQFAPEISRAGSRIQVVAAGPVVGRWDPLRLAQIVTNLVSNACKYGEGKPIEVSVEADDELARLTVRDFGIGIPPADMERVFERFERAVSARHYGGLGLGLYITRQVVEAHGGTIHVASQSGAGAVFSVELPRHRTPAAPGHAHGEGERGVA